MILTVSTIDLIENLQKITKGWRIDPLAHYEDPPHHLLGHDTTVSTYKLNPAQSSIDLFVEKQSLKPEKFQNTSLILIKIPKHELRIIQCRLVIDSKPMLRLTYWRAHGFRQNNRKLMGYQSNHYNYDYDKETVFRVGKIERIVRQRKKKNRKTNKVGQYYPSGRWSYKTPSASMIIYRDCVDIGVPSSSGHVALRARDTIVKSFELPNSQYRHGGGSRLRKQAELAVVLDGNNYYYSHLTVSEIKYV